MRRRAAVRASRLIEEHAFKEANKPLRTVTPVRVCVSVSVHVCVCGGGAVRWDEFSERIPR